VILQLIDYCSRDDHNAAAAATTCVTRKSVREIAACKQQNCCGALRACTQSDRPIIGRSFGRLRTYVSTRPRASIHASSLLSAASHPSILHRQPPQLPPARARAPPLKLFLISGLPRRRVGPAGLGFNVEDGARTMEAVINDDMCLAALSLSPSPCTPGHRQRRHRRGLHDSLPEGCQAQRARSISTRGAFVHLFISVSTSGCRVSKRRPVARFHGFRSALSDQQLENQP